MINVLAELERIGWGYDWSDDNNVKCLCPFHEDTSPSCYIHVKNEVFKCQAAGCLQKGDIITFLMGALKVPDRKVMLAELGKRYTLNDEKDINPDLIEKYHSQIWRAGPLLQALLERGVTDALIRYYRLGEHGGRVTIPIKNDAGIYVNIRSYLPGAPGAQKMKNLKGRSRPRLYPYEQMKFNKIVVTGGEMKAIVAANELNKHGYGAVCVTAGEGAWAPEFTPLFVGKDTWSLFDIDKGGQDANRKVCTTLYRSSRSTHAVLLPLDPEQYPKGDVNDFVARENGNLLEVIEKAEQFSPTRKTIIDMTEKPIKLNLMEATHADNTGKRMSVTAVISTLDTAPYVIPKSVIVHCSRDVKECALCPVMGEDPEKEYTISPESPSILEMVAQAKRAQLPTIMQDLDIPHTCRVCSIEPVTFYNVEDARISPRLEITTRTNERVMMPAICIGDGLEANETYELTGRMYPHPLNQQSTLLISKYTTSQDALSSYKTDAHDDLVIFQPRDWSDEAIADKLSEIYSDLEQNVTRIFLRRPIHIFTDFAYHSPLLIKYGDKQVKGWVEVLIVGDSSQGKTETVASLQRHYGLGEKVECKNASVAGLLGGLQQLGSRWFVTWGVIPTHDKRLVILEEVKGAPVEVISKLTDMRSSGIAEIPKIKQQRTHARTRLIALSNARRDVTINQYTHGLEAVKELIGGLEDVRRFDACLIVGEGDIDSSKLSVMRAASRTPHKYTSKLCRELVLWSWTRSIDQVQFDDDATSEIDRLSVELCQQYSEAIPIVDKGSMQYKLARLSAALSARLYSTENGECIRVRAGVVRYVVKLLIECYNSKSFGYNSFTEAKRISETLVDADKLIKAINDTPFPRDLINSLLHARTVDLTDIQDWCGWDRSSAQTLLSIFVRKHALQREGRHYKKTPPFIDLLKSMEPVDRPDFVKEEF